MNPQEIADAAGLQQIATQVVHAPYHSQCITCAAPEPRDIVWPNLTHSPMNIRVREALVMAFMVILFFFWLIPVTTLASLLSYAEVKKAAPWLGQLIDLNPKIRALVQTSLPSLAVIALNGLLPFLLEGADHHAIPHNSPMLICHCCSQVYLTFKVFAHGAGLRTHYSRSTSNSNCIFAVCSHLRLDPIGTSSSCL
jgi:hypothetical protein